MNLKNYQGLWEKAAEIPEMFTEVPASCVAHGKIFYYKTNLYIYEPSTNCWNTLICQGITLHSLLWQDENSCSNNNFIHGIGTLSMFLSSLI